MWLLLLKKVFFLISRAAPINNPKDLIAAQISGGDSVLTRLWCCVKNDGGRIDEQIDKISGSQLSAKSLTWSYANILHALHTRKRVVALFEKLSWCTMIDLMFGFHLWSNFLKAKRCKDYFLWKISLYKDKRRYRHKVQKSNTQV